MRRAASRGVAPGTLAVINIVDIVELRGGAGGAADWRRKNHVRPH